MQTDGQKDIQVHFRFTSGQLPVYFWGPLPAHFGSTSSPLPVHWTDTGWTQQILYFSSLILNKTEHVQTSKPRAKIIIKQQESVKSVDSDCNEIQ